jgi:hypothetical protein
MQPALRFSNSTCTRFLALVLGSLPRFASVSSRGSAPLGSAVLPVYNALGGPQGKGHVTFDRTQSQYLDAGQRTFNIRTNGGLTIVIVARFTGTAGDSERIIELAKWDVVNPYNANAFGVDKLQIYRQGTSADLLFEAGMLNSVTARMGSGNGVIVQDRWLTVVARWRESTKQFFFMVNNAGAIVP